MDDRTAIAWLHRRIGLGLAPGELDERTAAGLEATVERLLAPAASGADPVPDPWADLGLTNGGEALRTQARSAIGAWITGMASTPRPTESWLAWYWHGHFATSIAKVRSASMVAEQIRTLTRLGSGPFGPLLRALTVDPAMLVWLDGRDNTVDTPNENYGREVMELFSLGVGSYEEADVAAAARALSGWVVTRSDPATSRLVPKRHDDRPQRYLDRTDVRDADDVVAAITEQPSCASFLAGRLATRVLGDAADEDLVADLATTFRASDLDVGVLLRAVVEAGLDRLDDDPDLLPPVVLAPVPWLVAALRATGAQPPAKVLEQQLGAAGQVPMSPPNVGGWPGGAAWLATSTTVARTNLAVAVAQATAPEAAVRRSAAAGDDDALADQLGRPEGFGAATRAGLAAARRIGGPPGVAPLAIALAAPELVVA